MDWEFGISRYKLLYIEWINNKVLLYSTENYIQYPIVNHKGKELKKECVCVCVCITESVCCRAKINTSVNQLYFNKINLKGKQEVSYEPAAATEVNISQAFTVQACLYFYIKL